jgi:sugar/nucleoside kinase (ribokinase family)
VSALAVIGNISQDISAYPDGRRHTNLGGAALHIALAATRAGLAAAPLSVIGRDLSWLLTDHRLQALDLDGVAVAGEDESCAFHLTYDVHGDLTDVTARYGAAQHLTEHALHRLDQYRRFHVCCRRPLDAARVLTAITARAATFSVDFITSSAADYLSDVAHLLPHAAMVFTSDAEYRLLAATLDPESLPAVVVTRGAGPATLYRYGSPSATVQPPTTEAVDLTGAGDTLAGALLAATAAGATDQDALHGAVAAASAKVGTPHHVLLPPAPQE